jgi:hypothetical protein
MARSVEQDAAAEAVRGREIALRLWAAGVQHDSRRTRNRAVLIGRCSDPDNLWTAEGLIDKDGRAFDAHGRKSSCTSRLCPHCIKLIQRRSQTRLVTARDAFWNLHAPEYGKLERFITLTAPTLQGVAEYEAEKIYNRAFQLLTDRPFWTSRVDAGAKHLEFTVTERGYHPHIHVLIYGSFIERDAERERLSKEWRERRARERAEKAQARGLRLVKDEPLRPPPPLGNLQDQWTDCITIAAREWGYVIQWGAAEGCEAYSQYPLIDGGAVIQVQPTTAEKAGVDVRPVREKGRASDAEIGIASVIKELTKYITKASSWDAVSDEHLVEIAEVKRWPRCFELLGEWRKVPAAENVFAALLRVALLASGHYYICATARPVREVLTIVCGETWERFCERVQRANADPSSYVIAWDTLNNSEALYATQSGGNAYLDTDFVFRADPEPLEHSPPENDATRARAPSLMELGEVMAFNEWLKIVSVRLHQARRARQKLLARKYHYVERFTCLDGSTFEGLDYQTRGRESRIEAICQTMRGPY